MSRQSRKVTESRVRGALDSHWNNLALWALIKHVVQYVQGALWRILWPSRAALARRLRRRQGVARATVLPFRSVRPKLFLFHD